MHKLNTVIQHTQSYFFLPFSFFSHRRSGASCQGLRLRMRDRVSIQGGSGICKPPALRPKRTSPKKKHAIGNEVSAAAAISHFYRVTQSGSMSVCLEVEMCLLVV